MSREQELLEELYAMGLELSANMASHGCLVWRHAQKKEDRPAMAFGQTLELALEALVKDIKENGLFKHDPSSAKE